MARLKFFSIFDLNTAFGRRFFVFKFWDMHVAWYVGFGVFLGGNFFLSVKFIFGLVFFFVWFWIYYLYLDS